ncbi:MAG: hypothetical protein WCI74_14015, partial [Actinomycetes bacterium]
APAIVWDESVPAPEPPPEIPTNYTPAIAITMALIVGLGAAWLVLVMLIRTGLRRRLRAGTDSSQTIAGAWVWIRSASDHLHAPVPDSPRAVITGDDQPQELRDLAASAETALYSPDPVEAAQAEQAWILADGYVASTLAASGLRGRLRWWAKPIRSITKGRRKH